MKNSDKNLPKTCEYESKILGWIFGKILKIRIFEDQIFPFGKPSFCLFLMSSL